jgi:hypothetical protein
MDETTTSQSRSRDAVPTPLHGAGLPAAGIDPDLERATL